MKVRIEVERVRSERGYLDIEATSAADVEARITKFIQRDRIIALPILDWEPVEVMDVRLVGVSEVEES